MFCRKWDVYLLPGLSHLLQEELGIHPIVQCALIAVLDRGTVGQGVAEWHADLDQVSPCSGQLADDAAGIVQLRKPGCEIDIEDALRLPGKQLVNPIHGRCISYQARCAPSLAGRP